VLASLEYCSGMSIIKKLLSRVRSKWVSWFHAFASGSKISYMQEQVRELQKTNDYLMSIWLQGEQPFPNPLNAFGRKYFSQADEDGILLEILRRIGRNSGICLEIGAGDGTENNTLVLATRGWRTIWVDATPLAFDSECNPTLLSHQQVFVTAETAVQTVKSGMRKLSVRDLHVVSIDIDGNDGYLAEALLDDGFRPEVFVVEINELLPPPVKFAQRYDPKHVWDKTKNSGWSLQSFNDLLAARGYFCVGCNGQTGVNAFFVRSDFEEFFRDLPRDLDRLFVGRSVHPYKYRDHRTQISPRLIENILRDIQL
jgi:hypothetical protein